jgi:putative polyketide hydroxylase
VEAGRRARRLGTDKGCWRATKPSADLTTGTRASARSVEHSHPGFSPVTGAGLDGTRSGMLDVALGRRSPRGVPPWVRIRPAGGARPDAADRRTQEPGPQLWLRRAGAWLSTLDPHERSMVQTRR